MRPQMTGSLNAKLEYGLPALAGQGLRVPFADISLIDEGGLDIRLGNSLEVADSRRLSLEGGCLGLRHRTLVQDALLIRWPGLRKRPA